MASFEDLKERVKNDSQQLWERIQESSLYHRVKDRYENLSPTVQKLLLAGIALLTLGILVSIPLSSYFNGSENIALYESQRDLIRDLFKIQQDSQSSTGLEPAPPVDSLRQRMETEISQANLLPEQLGGISISDIPNDLPKDRIESALRVQLKKLNLRQLVDIGHHLASISSAVKMTDLSIEANAQDSRYFDVVYKFISLKVPIYIPPPPEPEPNKGKKPAKGKGKPKETDE